MKRVRINILLASTVLAAASAHAATLRVTTTGTGAPCGSTWAGACSLPAALGSAASGDEIWVADGTYATSGTSFDLVDGVKMIGGFDGTETAASESDPAANPTVLDGGGTDHVLTSTNNPATTIVRGFRITGGYDATGFMVIGGGGAALLQSSSAVFTACEFDNNTAAVWGGALAIYGATSPAFINCTFHDNGAVVIGAGPDPTTPIAGGAVFVDDSTPSFTNCLFHDNTGMEGGAIASVSGLVTLTNCTIADNAATIGRGGGLNAPSSVSNSILWGNTAIRGGDQATGSAISESDVQGGYTGTGNIDADPLFTNAAGGDYTLTASSPCADAADGQYLPVDVGDLDWDGDTTEAVPLDLGGAARVVTTLDMGADELPCPQRCCDDSNCFQGNVCCSGTCQACCDASDCGSGLMCCNGACQECCNNSDCPGFLNKCCAEQGYVCSMTCLD